MLMGVSDEPMFPYNPAAEFFNSIGNPAHSSISEVSARQRRKRPACVRGIELAVSTLF
jgi:hypothetical protein